MSEQSVHQPPIGDGMTLRDYVAAQALIGLLLHYHEEKAVGTDPFADLSTMAYQYADAMLAERGQ